MGTEIIKFIMSYKFLQFLQQFEGKLLQYRNALETFSSIAKLNCQPIS